MKNYSILLGFLSVLFFMMNSNAANNIVNDSDFKDNTNVATDDTMTLDTNPKYIIIYYSWSGHSRDLATEIYNQVGGDLIEVIPTTPYTTNYDEMLEIAPKEINAIDTNNIYPDINTSVESFDNYDLIFICTPLWWSRMSTPMQAFLNNHSNKLKGKQIALVVSSASSGISSVVADAKRLCPNSDFETPLWINNSNINTSGDNIALWLNDLDK